MGSRYDPKERRFKAKLAKVRAKGEEQLRRSYLKAEKAKYKPQKQTTKVWGGRIMVGLLLNGLVVECYAMVMMFYFRDMSYLGTLIQAAIGTMIGEVVAFAVYSCKAFLETKEEEALKFEREKLSLDNDDEPVG